MYTRTDQRRPALSLSLSFSLNAWQAADRGVRKEGRRGRKEEEEEEKEEPLGPLKQAWTMVWPGSWAGKKANKAKKQVWVVR